MALWRILVLGVLKQGLGCDFDRPSRPREPSRDGARVPGARRFRRQDVLRVPNGARQCVFVDAGAAVRSRAVGGGERGHAVAKKNPGEPLRGRCDSFVVETDVHYPTDVSLLWDAMRCVLRETGRAAGRHAVGGWRQWRHLSKEVRKLFNQVRSTRRAKRRPERVEAYLARCRALIERAVETLDELRDKGVEETTCQSIQGFIAACPAPARPSRAPTPAGRGDCSRGEGVLGLRGAYSLGFQGQGGHAGKNSGSR